ncbi:MAG: urease accessory protein UreD [Rikenellaceae bacterium]
MDAKIDLRVGLRSGRSVVRSLYVSPPFRVVSVGQLESDGAAYLMQMSTSPGVLSGDNYDLTFEVEDGASLQMKSQSYQRIYDMDGEAHQTIHIKIGDGARFSQVAHPIVPHRNSAFFSKTEVEMGKNSSFLQSEIITCGRKHHGEEFEFLEFSNSVEVRHGGVLRLKDRVWLSPTKMPISGCGLLEGETHQGTLVYQTTQEDQDIKSIVEAIHAILSRHQGIRFAVSSTHYSGFVIRLLGGGGEALFSAFSDVQNHIWKNR